jgi:hypothetical protein
MTIEYTWTEKAREQPDESVHRIADKSGLPVMAMFALYP